MRPQWRWRSMLVAGAVALASVASARADVPAPALPNVSLPPVSAPEVPSVSARSVPSVSTPSVASPQVPSLSAPGAPSVSAPGVSPVSVPRVPPGSEAAPGAPSVAAPGTSSGAGPAAARSRRSREPSSHRLHELLQPLAACVSALGPLQERVIVRRAGLRGFDGQSRRRVARALGLSRARVTRVEHRALRSLRRAVRSGGCAGGAPISSSPAATAAAGTTSRTAQAAAAGSTGAEGGAAPDRQEVKGVSQAGGGESPVERVLKAGPRVVAAAPRTVAAVTSEARSYADDHPLTFALALLVTLAAAGLLVRELRRAV